MTSMPSSVTPRASMRLSGEVTWEDCQKDEFNPVSER